jgi:hypothetical protein
MKPLIQKKGDLIKAFQANKVDYIMHCVNCQGVMGGGIAKQIKDTFPVVYSEYVKYCKEISDSNENLLGNVLIVDNVINIFAQNNFGMYERQVHYGALWSCLAVLSSGFNEIKHSGKVRVGVPKLMCCGLAGGSWEVVSEMLEAFPPWVEIVVYDFN